MGRHCGRVERALTRPGAKWVGRRWRLHPLIFLCASYPTLAAPAAPLFRSLDTLPIENCIAWRSLSAHGHAHQVEDAIEDVA
jgi:hypothetical protein